MAALIAFGHIAGAIVVLIAFWVGVMMITSWDVERSQKAALEDLSVELGVPVEELDNAENTAKTIKFSAARYSSDLLRNRLSDLCGWVQTGWGWLGTLVDVCVLLAVLWYTFTDSLANAIYAWWLVGLAILFWVVSVLFGLVCKLLTGRYPGQARLARKGLAQLVQQRRTV